MLSTVILVCVAHLALATNNESAIVTNSTSMLLDGSDRACSFEVNRTMRTACDYTGPPVQCTNGAEMLELRSIEEDPKTALTYECDITYRIIHNGKCVNGFCRAELDSIELPVCDPETLMSDDDW